MYYELSRAYRKATLLVGTYHVAGPREKRIYSVRFLYRFFTGDRTEKGMSTPRKLRVKPNLCFKKTRIFVWWNCKGLVYILETLSVAYLLPTNGANEPKNPVDNNARHDVHCS